VSDWKPEATEWDSFKEEEESARRAKLVREIEQRFGFTKGTSLVVQSRTGQSRVLKPSFLIEEIIKLTLGDQK